MNSNNDKLQLENFYISTILLICGYQMDKNKNYKTNLNNKKVSKYLKSYKINNEIIKHIKKNFAFDGKIIYLRNNVDSECMIYYSKKECYLVFIGTQFSLNDKMSLCKDLWTDICLGLKSIDFLDSDIKMHSKYIDNMNNDNLIEQIINIIKNFDYKTIKICGHSMGCGLGMYASIVLTKQFSNINFDLVTIDSPKIGNSKLNEYVRNISNLNHSDMINNNDIIPLFPFIFPNYLHIAQKTFFVKQNDFTINSNLNEITILTNHSINDHFTNNIITNIFKCLKKM